MILNKVFDEIFRTRSNVAVMRALMDTNTGFSGNEVARVAGMHPRSAFKALTLLEGLGIVNRQIGGRDHIFSLNRDNFLLKEAILKVFQVELNFKNEVMNSLAYILKQQVYSAVVFGSVAKKEENPYSDLDICCIVNTSSEALKVKQILNEKSNMLYKRFGIKLAPIIFSKSQFKNKKDSRLIRDIVNEGILITGRNIKGLFNDKKKR